MLIKCKNILDTNIQCLCSLVLGQYTNLIQTKLKQQATWEDVETDQDGIMLLSLIKTMVHCFKDQNFLPLVLYNAKLNLYSFCQGNLSNDKCLHEFNIV